MYKLIILGLLFFVGCSKPNTITYEPIKTPQKDLMEDKLVVYTSLTENNEPVKMASCKGCHFACPRCVE